jgi:hypothetical protein
MTFTQPSAQSHEFVNAVALEGDRAVHAHLAPAEEDRGSGRLQLLKPFAANSTDRIKDRSQAQQPTEPSSLRLIAIGSRQTLINNMKMLHLLRYADIGDWSKLQRGPNPGEFMSVLTLRSPHLWIS